MVVVAGQSQTPHRVPQNPPSRFVDLGFNSYSNSEYLLIIVSELVASVVPALLSDHAHKRPPRVHLVLEEW